MCVYLLNLILSGLSYNILVVCVYALVGMSALGGRRESYAPLVRVCESVFVCICLLVWVCYVMVLCN